MPNRMLLPSQRINRTLLGRFAAFVAAALLALWPVQSLAGTPLRAAAAPAPAAPLASQARASLGSNGLTTEFASYATSTYIRLTVPTDTVLGTPVTIGAVLRSGSSGAPIANQHLTLSLDGQAVRSDRTDSHGSITFAIQGKKLATAGPHTILVTFAGSHGWAASKATAKLTVLTAAVQIVSVPALAGIRFTLGGNSATTGFDGVAALPVPQAGTYQLTMDLNANTGDPSAKASFVRWLDNVYTANRTIDVSGPATYSVGIRVAYRASVRYVDLDNKPVDPSLIQSAQFSTGTGQGDLVLDSQTKATEVWWTAASIARIGSQLVASQVTYRVISVKIHGADVVNRGQQSWIPTENGTWTIQLLLYPMKVQTRDAVFGTPVSGNLQLTYPDGTKVYSQVASDGTTSFTDLPRGQYQLSLHPAAISPPSSVALSRPQAAILRVITFLDVALGAGLMVAIVIVLFFIGRGSHILRRRREKQAFRLIRPAA